MDQPTQRRWHALTTTAANGHSRLPGKVLTEISRAARHGIATAPTARLSSHEEARHSPEFPRQCTSTSVTSQIPTASTSFVPGDLEYDVRPAPDRVSLQRHLRPQFSPGPPRIKALNANQAKQLAASPFFRDTPSPGLVLVLRVSASSLKLRLAASIPSRKTPRLRLRNNCRKSLAQRSSRQLTCTFTQQRLQQFYARPQSVSLSVHPWLKTIPRSGPSGNTAAAVATDQTGASGGYNSSEL